MLFLLNDRVLDIANEVETLKHESAAGWRAPTLYQAVALGQRVIFAEGSFHHLHASVSLRLAAGIAMASEANAALFVRPANAVQFGQVAVRLAAAPLTTLARLEQYQRQGPLTTAAVNAYVWSLATGASAA
jgi:hypothetical protein